MNKRIFMWVLSLIITFAAMLCLIDLDIVWWKSYLIIIIPSVVNYIEGYVFGKMNRNGK